MVRELGTPRPLELQGVPVHGRPSTPSNTRRRPPSTHRDTVGIPTGGSWAKLSPHKNVNLRLTFPEKNAHTKCNLYLQTTTHVFTQIHAKIMALSFESQIPTLESGQSPAKNLLRPETLPLFLFLQLFEKTMIWGT